MFSFLRKHPDEDPPNVRLMKKMRFGGKDLDLNRAGELSEPQKKRFRQDLLGWVPFLAFYLGFLLLMAFISIAKTNGQSTANLFILGVLLAAILLIKAVIYWHDRKMSRGHVSAFTGQVVMCGVFMAINYTDRTQHLFSADQKISSAFIEGQRYTFYFPSFDESHILSAEHIPTETSRVSEAQNVIL